MHYNRQQSIRTISGFESMLFVLILYIVKYEVQDFYSLLQPLYRPTTYDRKCYSSSRQFGVRPQGGGRALHRTCMHHLCPFWQHRIMLLCNIIMSYVLAIQSAILEALALLLYRSYASSRLYIGTLAVEIQQQPKRPSCIYDVTGRHTNQNSSLHSRTNWQADDLISMQWWNIWLTP